MDNSGTWRDLDGGRVWRLRIQAHGARNLNLGITRFDMPDGAKLWIYDPAHQHVQGPYTSRNRSHRGTLWTPVIAGEEIVAEVFVPTGAPAPVIEIRHVNYGYRGLVGVLGLTEGACETDAICPEGDPWRDQIRAIGVYTIGGTSACTGNMMNNTALDRRPFILSANHCGVSAANDDTVVMYWNFESAVCGTHAAGPIDHSQTGAIFRASNAASDFLLFELSTMPDPAYDVFYAGWDRTGAIPAGTVVIHQPSADVKAISFDNDPPIIAANLSDTSNPAASHWRTILDSGILEHGSSGSCLFEKTHGRCIGQLHSGDNACPAGTSPHDWWGRFSVSWTGGGTDSTRLSNWLDPLGTGTLTLDGDPHITTANGINYDFQGAGEYVSARDGGMEIQTRITPISTTFFPGPDPHDDLATCVSVISAVAMRVGTHRVTYEPNVNGIPDPSGMQLRVDGVVTALGSSGLDLGGGARVKPTSASGGLQVDFPNGHVAFVTPGYWGDQGKWYLHVDLDRGRSVDGLDSSAPVMSGVSGLAGAIPGGSWLPRLPDGTSMGPMPATLQDRYNDLYQRFGGAWRVTNASSLFDYAAGTSTATFTMLNWPPQNGPCVVPREKPAEPATQEVAERVCREVKDPNARRNCVFDVRMTGNTGFATTYIHSQNVQAGTTTPTTPGPTSVSGKWAIFLDAGANFPQSAYSGAFGTGLSLNAGLEYMASSNVSVEGILGYHHLPSTFFESVDVFQLSGDAKVYFGPASSGVRLFVNGGFGAYKFDPGSTRFGGNAGAGLLFRITPRFGGQASYDLHAVNTPGPTFKFSTVQGGVRFTF